MMFLRFLGNDVMKWKISTVLNSPYDARLFFDEHNFWSITIIPHTKSFFSIICFLLYSGIMQHDTLNWTILSICYEIREEHNC
jgi:hypothetical protein